MSENSYVVQEDKRVRRTKRLIWEALLTLLQKQSFASTTVSAICDQALIHRATFYSHFADKYALLAYGVQDAFQTIVKDFDWNESTPRREAFLLPVLEYLSSHRSLFSPLLLEESAGGFSRQLVRRFARGFERELTIRERSAKQQTVPTVVAAQFYAGAVLQVLTWWMEHEMRMPPKELADYLNRLLSPIATG